MANAMLPFNVEIMKVDQQLLVTLKPVTSMDFYENVGGDLHEDGLFSISIFGRIGDEMRDKKFSFIDIKTQVFHPIIYQALIRLKGLYRGILAGNEYAVWDPELKDFVRSDDLRGQTGFQFFVDHWNEINFRGNKSSIRDARIQLIEKYRDRALTDKILVMPAGLRDIEVGEDGRVVVGDINTYYRKILAISRTIASSEHVNASRVLNLPRHTMQLTFNEIYSTIEMMLSGKRGFLQNKWGSRRIFNGTRNVITAMDTSTEYLGGPNAPKYTDTIVGLYQASKGMLPVTIHFLRTRYLADIFSVGDGQANLIDPTTLKGETVKLALDTYDRWTTVEGLEKVVSSYGEQTLRNKPVMLDGYYLALIYIGPDKTFRIFHSIDELPEGLDRAHVRPINLVELIYLSGYRDWNNYVGFVTRYPVTGIGSCYPTTLYVKTTIVGEMRRELGPDWQPLDDSIALEFPTYSPLAYLDSLVISPSRLAGLGADFDGDTASLNIIYGDESMAEIKHYLNSPEAYVDPRGGLRASANVDTVALVLRNMTG